MILFVSGVTLQQVLIDLLNTKFRKTTKKQYIQSLVSEMHKNTAYVVS